MTNDDYIEIFNMYFKPELTELGNYEYQAKYFHGLWQHYALRATKAEAMLEKAIEYLTLFRYTSEYYIEDQDREDANDLIERYRKEFGDEG